MIKHRALSGTQIVQATDPGLCILRSVTPFMFPSSRPLIKAIDRTASRLDDGRMYTSRPARERSEPFSKWDIVCAGWRLCSRGARCRSRTRLCPLFFIQPSTPSPRSALIAARGILLAFPGASDDPFSDPASESLGALCPPFRTPGDSSGRSSPMRARGVCPTLDPSPTPRLHIANALEIGRNGTLHQGARV